MANTGATDELFTEDANYLVDVGEDYPDEVLAKRWRWATETEEARFADLKESDPWAYAHLSNRIQDVCYGTLTEALTVDQVYAPMGHALRHLHGQEVIWVAEWKEPSHKGKPRHHRVYFMDVADIDEEDGVLVPAPMIGLMVREYPKEWRKKKKPQTNDIRGALSLGKSYCEEHGLTPRTTVL